jgi:VWFA-related protein
VPFESRPRPQLIAALLTALCVISLPARTQDAPTISTNVNLVTLLATVRDRDGRVINNLTANDFELKEDGAAQKIRYFSQESDLPLTIGLLVDTSRSQQGVLAGESGASLKFLDQVLREDKDQAFVVRFDRSVETLQGLTSSHSELSAALDRLTIPGEFGTQIYSAIREASGDPMRKQAGRKAMILLTDGVAFRDDASINDAIEAAQRADVILYSIRFSDSDFRGPLRIAVRAAMKERGKLALERMAEETGGVAYEVGKNLTIESIYSQIEEQLRNQYSIGYTPPRLGPDGKYHKIKLVTRDRNLAVKTRDGYYAK